MNVKAEAYQEWNQAAVVDKLLTNMADVVRAMAEPLSKVDRITIVSTGDGEAAGASKITGDMTKNAAQVPALFEALSGMDIKQLMVECAGDQEQAAGRQWRWDQELGAHRLRAIPGPKTRTRGTRPTAISRRNARIE